MNQETTQDIIYEFLQDVETPFNLDDFFKQTGIQRSKKMEEEIRKLILSIDEFAAEDSIFYPKISFLPGFPIRIKPTEVEIKKGILVPGHRLLPFYPAHLNADEISFTISGRKAPVKTKIISMKLPELHVYFNLMDMQKIPIINFEDMLNADSKLKFRALQLKDFYKAHDFQFGDTLIARSTDFREGEFSLEYNSYQDAQDHIFEIEKQDRQFMSTLKKVINQDLYFPNVEKQLLYTYFHINRAKGPDWKVPGNALGPLLAKTGEVSFSPLPNGRTVFHLKGQTIDDLAVYPDFEDLLDDEDEEFDLDNIDGMLQFLNNTNGLVTVRALLLDMIADNRRFKYRDIEDYLFSGLEKPYMPPEFRKRFKVMVNDEYKKLKKEFDPKLAYLPITTARKRILEESLEIAHFLRSLDEAMVGLDELPKNEMMHLMELDRSFNEILQELDQSQMKSQVDSAEVHRILRIVDKVSAELPQLFEVIRIKLKL